MEILDKAIEFLKKTLNSEKDQSVLGLDIGASSIKVVQLKKDKERAILETYGEIALGAYGNAEVGQSVRLTQDKIVEALKDVIREANVKAKKVAVAISLKSSFVTVINIPAVERKNISDIIKMEARRYIPVSVSEVFMDWWVFPEDKEVAEEITTKDEAKKKNFIKVLLVAIHKDVIEEYKNIVKNAGLEVGALELESFSMIRSSIGRETSPIAVVDFGASSTKVAVVDFGIIKTSYLINKGSQDLTLALSNSLNIDFRRAEEMKREIGFSNLPEHKEMTDVMEVILDFIFAELNSVIRDYQKKYNQTVGRTIIIGGGAMLKGLIDFAVKKLSMEVGLADPFSKTAYPVFLEGALKDSGPNFSIALGLALRELQ